MNNIKPQVFLYLMLIVSFSLSAQQKSQKVTKPSQDPYLLSTPADTLQYSLGAFVGQWLQRNGFEITNSVLFNKGITDIFENATLAVSDSTIVQRIASYQLSMQNEKNRQMEEQLFSSLKGKAGIGVLPNGVHYQIVKAGAGIRPTAADTVVVNAIGIFPDGTLFEDTFQKEQAITIATGSLIPGLSEAIQLMPEGSVWRIYIPSALAYGPAGLEGIIPSNMALVFDISLMEVKRKVK